MKSFYIIKMCCGHPPTILTKDHDVRIVCERCKSVVEGTVDDYDDYDDYDDLVEFWNKNTSPRENIIIVTINFINKFFKSSINQLLNICFKCLQ